MLFPLVCWSYNSNVQRSFQSILSKLKNQQSIARASLRVGLRRDHYLNLLYHLEDSLIYHFNHLHSPLLTWPEKHFINMGDFVNT